MRKNKKCKLNDEEADARFSAVRNKLEEMKEYGTLHRLPVDRIAPQPNMTASKLAVPDALVESIRKHGLLEPLTVRRIVDDRQQMGGLYMLISGAKRLQALKTLGFTHAPCLILDIPAGKAAEAVLSKKLCAQEPDVFRVADALARYARDAFFSDDTLAAQLCIDKRTLSAYLNLAGFQLSERCLSRAACIPRQLLLDIACLSSPSARKRALKECASSMLYLKAAVSDPFCSEGRRRGVFVSLLPFYNSIERIAAEMRLSGIAAVTERAENDEEYSVTVRIPKEMRRILISPDENTGAETPAVKFG